MCACVRVCVRERERDRERELELDRQREFYVRATEIFRTADVLVVRFYQK